MLGYENEHSGAALHGEPGQEGRGGFVPGEGQSAWQQ